MEGFKFAKLILGGRRARGEESELLRVVLIALILFNLGLDAGDLQVDRVGSLF